MLLAAAEVPSTKVPDSRDTLGIEDGRSLLAKSLPTKTVVDNALARIREVTSAAPDDPDKVLQILDATRYQLTHETTASAQHARKLMNTLRKDTAILGARAGHTQTCMAMITGYGVSCNTKARKSGLSLLHYAAWCGNEELCRTLCAYGAEHSSSPRYRELPEETAQRNGHARGARRRGYVDAVRDE